MLDSRVGEVCPRACATFSHWTVTPPCVGTIQGSYLAEPPQDRMSDPKPEHARDLSKIVDAVVARGDGIDFPVEFVEDPVSAPVPLREASKALWAQICDMTVPQRMRLALRGNREARMILRRDMNELVRRLVLQNPRISEDEIVLTAADRHSEKAILQAIADNLDWIKVYAVRQALVENAGTPIAISLRLLTSLTYQHLRALAKNKGIPGVIANQARRLAVRHQRTEERSQQRKKCER